MDGDTKTQMSVAQRRVLMELVKGDPDLLRAKFRADFTHKDAQVRWRKISSKLNAMPGARKDWKQWRKTWQDFRTRVKTRRTNSRLLTEQDVKIEGVFHDETPQPMEDVLPKHDPQFDMDLEPDSDASYKTPPVQRRHHLRPKKKVYNVTRDEMNLAENRLKYVLERELDIKSSYYERKLLLMERQVLALEKIANAATMVNKF